MTEKDAKGRTDDLGARVNVTAYYDLLRRKSEPLYDGEVHFRGGWYSLSEGDSAKDGFLRTLDDVAKEIEFIFLSETEDLQPFRRQDVIVGYESVAEREDTFGVRGYSDSRRAFSRRLLTDSEMNYLIRVTHERLRKSLYKKK